MASIQTKLDQCVFLLFNVSRKYLLHLSEMTALQLVFVNDSCSLIMPLAFVLKIQISKV